MQAGGDAALVLSAVARTLPHAVPPNLGQLGASSRAATLLGPGYTAGSNTETSPRATWVGPQAQGGHTSKRARGWQRRSRAEYFGVFVAARVVAVLVELAGAHPRDETPRAPVRLPRNEWARST